MWNDEQTITTLDGLFDRKIIDAAQYLSRLPKGSVPELNRLLNEIRRRKAENSDSE